MRFIGFIFVLLLTIVLLPFKIIDYLVFDLPRELRAKKWRANAKVGDKGYFINLLGGKTYFTIAKIDRRGKEHYRIETKSFASSSSQWTDLSGTYPDDRR